MGFDWGFWIENLSGLGNSYYLVWISLAASIVLDRAASEYRAYKKVICVIVPFCENTRIEWIIKLSKWSLKVIYDQQFGIIQNLQSTQEFRIRQFFGYFPAYTSLHIRNILFSKSPNVSLIFKKNPSFTFI